MGKIRKRELIGLVLLTMLLVLGAGTVQAAVKVSTPKSMTVAVGFRKKIDVYQYDTKKPKVKQELTISKWESSNKSIARVSNKGKVVGKKVGTCTITYTVKKKTYTLKVKVIPNTYTDKTSIKVRSVKYGEPSVVIRRAWFQGNTLKLNVTVFNNRMYRMRKFNWLTLKLYSKRTGKTYMTKKFSNLACEAPAYGRAHLTLSIPRKAAFNLTDELAYTYDYVYTFDTKDAKSKK